MTKFHYSATECLGSSPSLEVFKERLDGHESGSLNYSSLGLALQTFSHLGHSALDAYQLVDIL